jgi:hypothetical protein
MKNKIFHDSHVELTLDKSKTDIYRRCNTVVIAKTGNDIKIMVPFNCIKM